VRALALGLLVVGIVGALARPRGLAAWIVPTAAACTALATGVLDLGEARDAFRPLAGPLGFVLVAVPLAVSLDRVGVFEELARLAARRRHVVGSCWILAALVVAFLNLDAAVVLLTPLYVRTALLVDVDPVALAFQPVLLASLASSALAVSNLTNLMAASQLSLSNVDFLRHLALPSLVASTVGWFAYRAVFRMKPQTTIVEHVADRRALTVGLGAIACFLALLVGGEYFGVAAWQAALITEVGLIAVTRRVPWRAVPLGTAALAAALGVLAAGVAAHWPDAFSALGAGGARGFGAGIASANVLNNLPAVLVGLPHIAVTSHVWPLLLGVNLGPTLVITGSLAGLLWQESARRAGVEVSAARYSSVGIRVGVPAMIAAAAVLFLLG
jgi:arsenical pump membrane protein